MAAFERLEKRPRWARLQGLIADARRRIGQRIAGAPIVPVPELEVQTSAAEAAAALKDELYERGRARWLESRYAIGDLEERPNVPLRFVLVDAAGEAHGLYRAELGVRSPLRGHP